MEEYLKETRKKAWFITNNIIWTIIFLYPLLGIIDFIYTTNYWVEIMVVRVIVVVVCISVPGRVICIRVAESREVEIGQGMDEVRQVKIGEENGVD